MINDLTGFPILQEGMLRAAPLGALPRVVADLGHSFDGLCAALGLPADLVDNPESAVSIEVGGRLLAACAQRTACPHLGLLVGASIGLETLGAIGSLARQAPSAGAALRGLILALHLHDRATVPTLSTAGDTAILGTVPLGELPAGGEEVADLTMMACHNLMWELCGPAWHPREVMLARRPPPDPQPYRRTFKAPVRFDADHNALVFDRRWLSQPMRKTAGMHTEALVEMAKAHPVDLPLRVRRACVTAIVIGDASVERLAKLGLQSSLAQSPPRRLWHDRALRAAAGQAPDGAATPCRHRSPGARHRGDAFLQRRRRLHPRLSQPRRQCALTLARRPGERPDRPWRLEADQGRLARGPLEGSHGPIRGPGETA